MNDRQFFALQMPARGMGESTGSDYQEVIRSPSGALVLSVLVVEVLNGYASWHAVAMVLDPLTKEIAPLKAIPLRLHSELRTIAAKLLIGVGRDPSEVKAEKLGWHVYRLLTVDEQGKLGDPIPDEVIKAAAIDAPLIVRPDGATPELLEHGFESTDLVPTIPSSRPSDEEPTS